MGTFAATLAAASVVGLIQPSVSGSTRQFHNDYYYRSYDTAFEPVCVVRTVRGYDAFGNPVTRKVRVCR